MQQVYEAIQQVSQSQATVLLRGESGTGKEVVAKAIHQASTRQDHPFVVVHCAAVPESLIESTLFGHERGAFTGAIQVRKGKLEQVAGGTLFLDEIGDISLETQVKLLRVIQEKEFERIGSMETIRTDLRIIAATHRDLEARVSTGHFRDDLYYRLNVVPITLPPLRERKEDIPLLIQHFLAHFNHENQRNVQFDQEVFTLLAEFHWPGNIRELQNCIERLVVCSDSSNLSVSSIPLSLHSYFDHMRKVLYSTTRSETQGKAENLPARVNALEQDRLVKTLQRVGWVKAKAARILGLTPRQVSYKMRKYDVRQNPESPL
jgi:Nif-specific regulatory protein